MGQPQITDWLQVVAAALTALAATAALIIAWRAPKSAAQWAETYRQQSEELSERHKLKMQVFIALMKCRSQILHSDAVAALNLIDAAFFDDEAVRDAYRSFSEATVNSPENADRIIERYHLVIDKVAQAVGMGGYIRQSDIRSGYYPTALGRLDEAALAEAEEKIARRASKSRSTKG